MTNREWLESLSDEELANELEKYKKALKLAISYFEPKFCPFKYARADIECELRCVECWAKYFLEEVEADNDDDE